MALSKGRDSPGFASRWWEWGGRVLVLEPCAISGRICFAHYETNTSQAA